MKVSVITINYNNIQGLKTTIQSVISQSYKDMEYIMLIKHDINYKRSISQLRLLFL